MPFPYRHANGGICCTDRYTCCDNCKAKLVAEKTSRNLASRLSDYEPPDSVQGRSREAATRVGRATTSTADRTNRLRPSRLLRGGSREAATREQAFPMKSLPSPSFPLAGGPEAGARLA